MEHSSLLIGIGGAGCAIADQVRAALGGRLVRVNAREDISPAAPTVATIPLLTRPRGMRSITEVSNCAELAREYLSALLVGRSQVFLFAGFGGAVGSGATPVIARISSEGGHEVVAFVTLPFALETQAVMVAKQALGALHPVCSTLSVYDHDLASRQIANAGLGMVALLDLSATAAIAFTRKHMKELV
jgi:cell division GTPase FtsZ